MIYGLIKIKVMFLEQNIYDSLSAAFDNCFVPMSSLSLLNKNISSILWLRRKEARSPTCLKSPRSVGREERPRSLSTVPRLKKNIHLHAMETKIFETKIQH